METRRSFPMNKPFVSVMAVFHLGAFAALFFYTPGHLALCATMWLIASLGVGIGYHRLLTHRGFKTYLWFEYMWVVFACLALQRDPITWVSEHREHHAHAEIPGKDPHTPRDGGWWSHIDWLIHPNPKSHDRERLHKLVPDLLKHKFYRQLENLFLLPMILLGIVFFFVGGIPAVLWGICLPAVVCLHFTFFVNSATHMWGKRRFPTRDDSTNLWWVAILTHGEGNHNNHHHDPVNPRHGIKWYEWDLIWYILWFLRGVGLVWKTKDQAKLHLNH